MYTEAGGAIKSPTRTALLLQAGVPESQRGHSS